MFRLSPVPFPNSSISHNKKKKNIIYCKFHYYWFKFNCFGFKSDEIDSFWEFIEVDGDWWKRMSEVASSDACHVTIHCQIPEFLYFLYFFISYISLISINLFHFNSI